MGIGLLELVVIAVAALLLLGPDKLPDVIKQLGRFYVQLRRTSTEVRGAFDSVVRQAEEESRLEEIKRLMALAQSDAKSMEASIQDPHHGPANDYGHDPQEDHQTFNKDIPSSVAVSLKDGNHLGRSELAVQVFDNPQPILPEGHLTSPKAPTTSELDPLKSPDKPT